MKLQAYQRLHASFWQQELAQSPKLLKAVTALSKLVKIHDILTDGYDSPDSEGVYEGCEVYFSGHDEIDGSYETGINLKTMQSIASALHSDGVNGVICAGDNSERSRLTIVLTLG